MDFNFKKPTHIIALLLILITFTLIIFLPIFTFFGLFPSTQSLDYQNFPDSYRLIFEIFVLFFQLVFVIFLMVIFPFVWYILVNRFNFKKILSQLKLTFDNIEIAFLWGIITSILIFAISFVIGIIIVVVFNLNTQDISNIPDLEALFSPVVLFLLVAIQPVAEEIFFRGFLLDKISSLTSQNVAIFSTAILFGLAHATYLKVYPIILPMIMGVLLAYVVIKTKNLYTVIIAHVCFNVGSLILTFIARSLMP
jgi:membrane protease YdiL (CAAX protease family)